MIKKCEDCKQEFKYKEKDYYSNNKKFCNSCLKTHRKRSKLKYYYKTKGAKN
jgi:hypothetical protein